MEDLPGDRPPVKEMMSLHIALLKTDHALARGSVTEIWDCCLAHSIPHTQKSWWITAGSGSLRPGMGWAMACRGRDWFGYWQRSNFRP